MNSFYLLLLLPTVPIVGWAIYTKFKEQKHCEALLIGIPAIVAYVDALLLHYTMAGPVSPWLQWMQMLITATIVPLAYLYFSRQLGRQFNNGTNILLWLLFVLLFIPRCVIFLSGEAASINSDQIRLFSIQVFRGNEEVFWLFTGDFVIIAQSLITMMRMVPMMRTLRRYGLIIDRKMYAFAIWWAMAILFIITVSLSDFSDLGTPLGLLYYNGGLFLLLSTIYLLIALHFDLHPVKTQEGNTVHNVHSYIGHQSQISTQVRHLVEEDRVYLQPGYSTEDVLKALATNRTYFTRMMQETFGKTFSQYLNEHRLAHAQHLLLTTELSQNEIAMQSGFSDASYMSRVFKSNYNLTPHQWQTQHQQEE